MKPLIIALTLVIYGTSLASADLEVPDYIDFGECLTGVEHLSALYSRRIVVVNTSQKNIFLYSMVNEDDYSVSSSEGENFTSLVGGKYGIKSVPTLLKPGDSSFATLNYYSTKTKIGSNNSVLYGEIRYQYFFEDEPFIFHYDTTKYKAVSIERDGIFSSTSLNFGHLICESLFNYGLDKEVFLSIFNKTDDEIIVDSISRQIIGENFVDIGFARYDPLVVIDYNLLELPHLLETRTAYRYYVLYRPVAFETSKLILSFYLTENGEPRTIKDSIVYDSKPLDKGRIGLDLNTLRAENLGEIVTSEKGFITACELKDVYLEEVEFPEEYFDTSEMEFVFDYGSLPFLLNKEVVYDYRIKYHPAVYGNRRGFINFYFRTAEGEKFKRCIYLETIINDIPPTWTDIDNYIMIYPQPASEEINVKISGENEGIAKRVELFNLIGKKVYESNFEMEDDNLKIPVSDLSSGIYYLSLDFGKSRVSRKVIIEN